MAANLALLSLTGFSCLLLMGQAPPPHAAPPAVTTPAVPAQAVPAEGATPPVVCPAEKLSPAWLIDANGARRLPDRCEAMPADAAGAAITVVMPPPRQVAAPAMDSAACDPPWFVDDAGIQRLRLECLDSELDAPALPVSGASVPGCAPYWIDSSGIRRLRLE